MATATTGMTTQVAENFLAKQLSFSDKSFEDNPVPGIGEKGRAKMNENKITNAAQVMGIYLLLDGNDDKMYEILVTNCECHGPSVKKDFEHGGTLAVLREKCKNFIKGPANGGLETLTSGVPFEAGGGGAAGPAPAPAPAPASGGTTQVMDNFISKQMSWDDDFDKFPVPGLGKVGRGKIANNSWKFHDEIAKGFALGSITKPHQLIGVCECA